MPSGTPDPELAFILPDVSNDDNGTKKRKLPDDETPPVLTYFNVAGRGFGPRVALGAAGIVYEVRIPL